jgi:alcohol dehydrogenase class IV
LNHLTLPEIKDFNVLDDVKCFRLNAKRYSCRNEPSLPDIELTLAQLNGFRPDVVIALGGESVIDFAKALATLIPCNVKSLAYLDVVGDDCALENPPIPMIALPTTAGTGAEVTKNAVISVPEYGLKVSLRAPRMIPLIAIVDPNLMQGAPQRKELFTSARISNRVPFSRKNKIRPHTMFARVCGGRCSLE